MTLRMGQLEVGGRGDFRRPWGVTAELFPIRDEMEQIISKGKFI